MPGNQSEARHCFRMIHFSGLALGQEIIVAVLSIVYLVIPSLLFDTGEVNLARTTISPCATRKNDKASTGSSPPRQPGDK